MQNYVMWDKFQMILEHLEGSSPLPQEKAIQILKEIMACQGQRRDALWEFKHSLGLMKYEDNPSLTKKKIFAKIDVYRNTLNNEYYKG